MYDLKNIVFKFGRYNNYIADCLLLIGYYIADR